MLNEIEVLLFLFLHIKRRKKKILFFFSMLISEKTIDLLKEFHQVLFKKNIQINIGNSITIKY